MSIRAPVTPLHPRVVAGVLSKVIEVAPNGVALTTADGHILLTNAELERMFGFTRAQLLGRPIEDLIPERFRSSHCELRTRGGTDQRPRAVGSGRELCGLRADGTEFPIEIGMSGLVTPDGAMVVETIVDISVRKRLERIFQKMVEAAPYAMVVTEAQGRILLVNPQAEAMFRYAPGELVGHELEVLLPERLRAKHGNDRRTFVGAPSIRLMGSGRDLIGRRKDGTEFPVEIGLNPLAGEDSGLVVAAVCDISRRKALELELQHANANLEEFTCAVSHDLRSPLRGIGQLIEWIGEDLAGNKSPQITHNLERAAARVHRLEQIVEDLLTYARAGAQSDDTMTIEPRALIGAVLELQPPPPGFRVSVHADATAFVAVRAPLETVLRNLIGNAVKHHDRPSGNLKILVEDADQYCLFTVLDDGPGIAAAAHEKIFFATSQEAPARPGASYGIGLALSKRLVELHGGRMALNSPPGARGTAARVWWPRLRQNKQP